jgi:Eco57I restriction-modification methylase
MQEFSKKFLNQIIQEYQNLIQITIKAKTRIEDSFSIIDIQNVEWKIKLGENSLCNDSKFDEVLQNKVISPNNLADLLENYNLDSIAKKGGIFTPYKIAKEMVDCSYDVWLLDRIRSKFNILSQKNRPISFNSQFSNWFEENENSMIIKIIREIFEEIIPKMRILDPCVGGGIFILIFIQKLFNFFLNYYGIYDIISQKHIKSILKPDLRVLLNSKVLPFPSINQIQDIKQIFSTLPSLLQNSITDMIISVIKNLTFFDLEPKAVKITQIRIKCLLMSVFPVESYDKLIEIDHIGQEFNFLTHNENSMQKQKDFDLIIGNPPYIGSDKMKKEFSIDEINKFKNQFKIVIVPGSKPDMYAYFLKKTIDNLAYNGLLCFIIPNRILSNNSTINLRMFLFDHCIIRQIVDFDSNIPVFVNANVHPCILVVSKKPKPTKNVVKLSSNHQYYANFIKTLESYQNFDIFQNKFEIQHDIAYHYNILFSKLTPKINQILEKIKNNKKLGEIVTIHEGTREARFKKRFSSGFPIQISRSDWLALNQQKKEQYLREIRGKEIDRYSISSSRFYFCHPDLLENDIERKHQIITKYSVPTLFIRELGKIMIVGIDERKVSPSIGYGGVYYFSNSDIKKDFDLRDQNLTEIEILHAFNSYLCSKVVLFLYKTLFSAGSWGDALKFRSSYLHNLPMISFDMALFSNFGFILNHIVDSGRNNVNNSSLAFSKTEQQNFISLIESLIDTYLIASLIPDVSSQEYIQFRNILIEFSQKVKNNIKEIEEIIMVLKSQSNFKKIFESITNSQIYLSFSRFFD